MSERNRTADKSTGPRDGAAAVTGIAPGRVNLIGEHVDYNGGRCLPLPLTRTTSARLSLRPDDVVRVTSGSRSWTGDLARLDGGVQDTDSWVLYVVGVL